MRFGLDSKDMGDEDQEKKNKDGSVSIVVSVLLAVLVLLIIGVLFLLSKPMDPAMKYGYGPEPRMWGYRFNR